MESHHGKQIDRRQFITRTSSGMAIASGVILTGGLFFGCKKGEIESVADPLFKDLKLFKGKQARTLQAVLEQILPRNIPPGTPGAREARVIQFVDSEILKPQFKALLPILQKGIAALDQVSQKENNAPYYLVESTTQKKLLTRFQKGEKVPSGVNTARFFAILLTLSMEGFLAHPIHGGNADYVVWKSLGYDIGCREVGVVKL